MQPKAAKVSTGIAPMFYCISRKQLLSTHFFKIIVS